MQTGSVFVYFNLALREGMKAYNHFLNLLPFEHAFWEPTSPVKELRSHQRTK